MCVIGGGTREDPWKLESRGRLKYRYPRILESHYDFCGVYNRVLVVVARLYWRFELPLKLV